MFERILKPLLKRLNLFEMEGKFDVRRPVNAVTPLTRTDKFFNYSLNQLEGVDELKELKQLSRYLFFLPFEINKKIPLSLQVSEQFQISFFDSKHSEIQEKADSAFGENDTGVKLTIAYFLYSSSNQIEGEVHIRDKTQKDYTKFQWEENSVLMFNSRAFTYKVNKSATGYMLMT